MRREGVRSELGLQNKRKDDIQTAGKMTCWITIEATKQDRDDIQPGEGRDVRSSVRLQTTRAHTLGIAKEGDKLDRRCDYKIGSGMTLEVERESHVSNRECDYKQEQGRRTCWRCRVEVIVRSQL